MKQYCTVKNFWKNIRNKIMKKIIAIVGLLMMFLLILGYVLYDMFIEPIITLYNKFGFNGIIIFIIMWIVIIVIFYLIFKFINWAIKTLS